MLELLTNAVQGWTQYIQSGKYAALLLVVLLFLWFRGKKEKEKVLLLYTTVVTVMCIIPASAAVLMTYQTRYYDYKWIWNYVPVTLMIAYGGTIFLTECWTQYKKNLWKCAGITAALLVVFVLCTSIGSEQAYSTTASRESEEVQAVLAVLAQEAKTEEICLWAPKEILEEARAYDGNIRLLYGRNMWDVALGGYSYETYDKTVEALYLWMCQVEENGIDISYLKTAKEQGVNRIVLPGSVDSASLQQAAAAMDADMTQLGEYFLLTLE